jgi:hypothetical protein
MTTLDSGSATIIQFPARGRFAGSVERDDAKIASTSSLPRVAKIAVGGAWYHDQAIRDDDGRVS